MPYEDGEDLPQVESGAVSVDAVRRRVEDWLGRLSLFLKQNEAWAFQHGWRAASVGDVRMHEELMRDFSVPPARQPTLRLDGPDGAYALFKPKGLWVIGANGRIDLYTGKGAYVIVDRAERFQPPEWTIFRSDGNRDGAPYSPDLLQRLS